MLSLRSVALFPLVVMIVCSASDALADASAVSTPVQTVTTTTTTTTSTTTQATAEPKCSKDAGPTCEEPTVDLDTVAAIRLSFLHVSGPENTGSAGAQFWFSGEGYKTIGLLSLRSSALAGLGGGTGGIEGSLGFFGAAGIRVPVAATHGPFIRVGLGGELLGNQQFYFSHIDLPFGEAGYQYLNGATVFELGMRAAPLLTGRYNTGDSARRELGTSFEWAGFLDAKSRFGKIDLSFLRIEARKTPPDTPVDVVRGSACAFPVSYLAICLDAMYVHGDEQPPLVVPAGATGDTTASALYGGASVGLRY
ncbi:MAG: hypothetical protein ABI551_01535 [Polyangiaceae bacterium]